MSFLVGLIIFTTATAVLGGSILTIGIFKIPINSDNRGIQAFGLMTFGFILGVVVAYITQRGVIQIILIIFTTTAVVLGGLGLTIGVFKIQINFQSRGVQRVGLVIFILAFSGAVTYGIIT